MANMSLVKTPMPEQDPKVRARNFKEVRHNERDALYFLGTSDKHLRRKPQVNRHNGGVGRKHCNTSLGSENAEITVSGHVRESIARVSQVPDEYHPFADNPIVLDGL